MKLQEIVERLDELHQQGISLMPPVSRMGPYLDFQRLAWNDWTALSAVLKQDAKLTAIIALARQHASPASNPGAHALACSVLRIVGKRE